jgi:hypothetical protein
VAGRPAPSGDAAPPRVVVLHGAEAREVFEVVSLTGAVLAVRAAYLFEIGEELAVRLERDGTATEARAWVRGHRGPAGALITELVLDEATGER